MRRVLMAVVAVSATACLDNVSGPDVVAGVPFQLKPGEIATIPDSARLRFDAVRADSRCPIDAICITAGDATIAVTLLRSSGQVAHELHTMPPQSQFSYSGYVVKLTELQPYPRSGRQSKPGDYIASFVVQTQ